jgi:hypothetical protein
VSIVARIVGLISGWPAAAAGARLDADAHDWLNRHGTREKRLDELAKQHHTNTVHMTDDHIPDCDIPAVLLPADVLDEWTTVSRHDWQHHNNHHNPARQQYLAARHHRAGVSGPKRTSAPFSAAFVPPGSIHHVHVATTTTGTIHLVCMRRMQEMRCRRRHSLPREDTRPASSPPSASRSCDATAALLPPPWPYHCDCACPPYSQLNRLARKAYHMAHHHHHHQDCLTATQTSTSVTHRQKTTNHGLICLVAP